MRLHQRGIIARGYPTAAAIARRGRAAQRRASRNQRRPWPCTVAEKLCEAAFAGCAAQSIAGGAERAVARERDSSGPSSSASLRRALLPRPRWLENESQVMVTSAGNVTRARVALGHRAGAVLVGDVTCGGGRILARALDRDVATERERRGGDDARPPTANATATFHDRTRMPVQCTGLRFPIGG